MKLRMEEAGAGYGPRGMIEGWTAGQVIEIDARNPREKAWADGWLNMGAVDVTADKAAVPTPTITATRAQRGAK